MHDPKFEKAVQRKMDDLEFVPSESVWENIQRAVAPRRRRRAVALFWWWLVPGVLLLGGGALYRHSASAPASVVSAASGVAGHGAASGKSGGAAANAPAVAVVAAMRSGNAAPRMGDAAMHSGSDAAARTASRATGTGYAPDDAANVIGGAGTAGVENGGVSAGAGSNAAAPGKAGRRKDAGYQPGLIGVVVSAAGITAPRLYPKPVKTAVSGLPAPRRPWMAGFAGGAGVASVTRSAMGKTAAGATFSTLGAYAVPAALASNVSGARRYTSDIGPDVSYWAGVFAEKPLSARWSLDLGLNVHYYSTKLRTDQLVNSFAPVSATLISASALTYAAPAAAVSGGDGTQSYINQYYYLEFPAAVQWKINRSALLPLFWRGGVVFSYLMGEDGVYYDGHSGSYSKDNAVVRHAQASVNSGLMVGLPVKGVRIQAGPEVQYEVTNMLNAGAGGSHLFYGGMRVALMR